MQRKLSLLACIVFISMSSRCLPISPTPDTSENTGLIGTTTSAGDGNSGIRGTTRSVVISGVPGGPTTEAAVSIEFAIAPVQADKPIYEKAIFVKSDAQGMFEVKLPPGTYWIGPKAKALDPANYDPGPVVFSEMIVAVKAGTFLSVELVETGYAP